MSGSLTKSDRWWLWGLLAAALAMLEAILIRYWPQSFWSYLALIGAAAFIVVMYFHPARRFHRRVTGCLAAGAAIGAIPGMAIALDWHGQGSANVFIDASPWVAIVFVLAGVLFGVLDLKLDKAQGADTRPGTAMPPLTQSNIVQASDLSTAGSQSPNIVGDGHTIHITQGSVDSKTLKKIVDRYETQLAGYETRLERSEQEKSSL